MPLFRSQVTYEFCIDAPDMEQAHKIFQREHTAAIEDDRCAIKGEVEMELVEDSTQFEEPTLDEVPLNALDHTLRERLASDDPDPAH